MHTLTDALNDLKQRAAEDPAALRYMALEAENNQLRHEIAQLHQETSHLRAQLGADSFRPAPMMQQQQHQLAPVPTDDFGFQRDSKRRKRSDDEPYLASASASFALLPPSLPPPGVGSDVPSSKDPPHNEHYTHTYLLLFAFLFISPSIGRGSVILVSTLLSRWRPRRLEL